MAFTEETRLSQIEILSNGRIQFREETQVFKDGVPITAPVYHRSSVDPGYLDENGELVLNPLPVDQSLGLNSDIDLNKLLQAVRTPAVLAAWKAKLIEDLQASKARKKKL